MTITKINSTLGCFLNIDRIVIPVSMISSAKEYSIANTVSLEMDTIKIHMNNYM